MLTRGRLSLRVALVVQLAVAVSALTAPLPASADGAACGTGEIFDPRTRTCTVVAHDGGSHDPGRDQRETTPVAEKRAGQGAVQPVCRDRNISTRKLEPVPCRSGQGYWSNDRECYIRPMRPQPALGSPLRDGHQDGAVYECVRTMGQVTVTTRFWSANAPAAPAAPPDPAVVARTIVASMKLRSITIGMAPEDVPGSIGIVGLPAWMWVAKPSPQTFGPLTRSASVGGTTVTATASVQRVVWTMGDGTSATCGRGTPFADGDGGFESPDCGHIYQRQGAYTVRATSSWAVEWTSNSGASGTIPLNLTATRRLVVGEVQVVRS